jgi:MFS family permease
VSVGYRELLRENADYRHLWLAEVISFAGDWFNTIALYTAVAELSSSTEAIAGVFVAKMLPIFVVTPVAGPLVDRFDRRHVMVASDAARMLCAIGLIAAYRAESLAAVMTLVVVMVGFTGVFMPAKSAVMPQIVRHGALGAANALSGATWSAMLALGAALGGVVTALIGVELALVVDGLTFLLSMLFLLRLPSLPPDEDEPSSTKRPTERGFTAGLRYLKRRPYLAAIIAIKPCMALTGGAAAMLPVFGTRVFDAASGPLYIGLLYTARGLGALMGSLGLRRVFGDAPRTMRLLIAPLFAVAGLSYLGLSFAPSIGWAALAYLGTTLGGSGLWVFSGTLGQLESDNAYRGRVFSVEMGVHTLVLSVTASSAGSLVDRAAWAVQDIARASSALVVLPIAMWLLVIARTRKRDAT